MNKADEVFCASVGLWLRPTCEAKEALTAVRDWLERLASGAPRNISAKKQLGLQIIIKKLSADVLNLGSVERMLSHLASVDPARQAALLNRIMTHCASAKEVPDGYSWGDESPYTLGMIAWTHGIVCELYQIHANSDFAAEGDRMLNKWVPALESIREIQEGCTRLLSYTNECLRLDQARAECAEIMMLS
jgi:hypothetical protein